MDSVCSACARTPQIRVDLAELAEMDRKLRSEFGPSVVSLEEADDLKVMLALADKDIEVHDPELACFRHRILVQAERQLLEIQRDKLRSLLSPMRKLPNEILLPILQYVCSRNFLQSYPWIPYQRYSTKTTSPISTYLPTMAVSSVCSRWRELALSSPSLWTNLDMEICPATTNETKTLVGFIGTVARYLERSVYSPLRLALSVVQSHSPDATEIPSLIHLTRHAFRWKTFLYHGHSSLVYSILSRLKFPLLTELDVCTGGSNRVTWNCFEHSPRLHELVTDTIPASVAICNQLHSLHYRGSSLRDLAEILHGCPSLKSLVLNSRYQVNRNSRAQGTGHNITSLVIMEHFSHPCSEMVFSLFNFPSLHELVVDGDAGEKMTYCWPADVFISFVFRSSCMITKFLLLNISLSDLELIAVLQVMPALVHLEVDDRKALHPLLSMYERGPITSRLTSSLTQLQSTSISLAPKLHTLHLRSHLNTGAFDDSAFVSMVQSRWFKPGSDLSSEMLAIGRGGIRSVVLKFFWREVDAEVYKPLRVLDKEGLRVVVAGTNGVQV